MGEQFDQLAAFAARLLDRPSDQLFADAAAAAIGGDADVLDQAARGTLRTQARQHAKLQATDDTAALLGHHELDVRIAIEHLERLEVRRRQRLFEPLTRAASLRPDDPVIGVEFARALAPCGTRAMRSRPSLSPPRVA